MIHPLDESITTLSLGPESLPMRKINTRNFRLATRSTPREVNRRIVLNLIREYQPISRAELARRMQGHDDPAGARAGRERRGVREGHGGNRARAPPHAALRPDPRSARHRRRR